MIWVPPQEIVFKITSVRRMTGVIGGDWDLKKRVLLSDTDKHKSMYQRFVEGKCWEETDCFTNLYVHRFRPHESRNGAEEYADRLRRYRTTVEITFESLKADGFKTDVDLPRVLIGRSGDIMLGNQGNHRVAMAKILQMDQIPVEVVCRHIAWTRLRRTVTDHPDCI